MGCPRKESSPCLQGPGMGADVFAGSEQAICNVLSGIITTTSVGGLLLSPLTVLLSVTDVRRWRLAQHAQSSSLEEHAM